MTSVSRNTDRNCRVNERDIEQGFRVTVYPALMDLEVENNNMICAVKEIYSRFVNDTYIAQRIKVCKATLLGDLVVEVANIVEKQIDQARKAKKEMVGEIQAKFLEVSDKIDKQVKKMFKDADEKHNNFVENRAKNYVFEYNRLAEEDRLAKCDIRKKKLFHKVYLELKPLTGHPSEIGSKSSHSSSSGNPVPIQFKSNTTFTTSVNNPNNDSSKKDANKSEKTVNDTNPIKPAQVDTSAKSVAVRLVALVVSMVRSARAPGRISPVSDHPRNAAGSTVSARRMSAVLIPLALIATNSGRVSRSAM